MTGWHKSNIRYMSNAKFTQPILMLTKYEDDVQSR